MKIEIIATTLKEAIDAEKYGADRIELVSDIQEGGLTPSLSLIKKVCDTVNIPVNVMVRPHSKSFVYDKIDFNSILKDIEMIKKTKANGIVFGSLNQDGEINIGQLKKVLQSKGNLAITFHRAIDSTRNYLQELKKLVRYEIDIILTSGGNPKATDDYSIMTEAVENAKENNVTILAGSGLYLHTVKDFIENVPVEQIHIGSGVRCDNSSKNDINPESMRRLLKKIKKDAL